MRFFLVLSKAVASPATRRVSLLALVGAGTLVGGQAARAALINDAVYGTGISPTLTSANWAAGPGGIGGAAALNGHPSGVDWTVRGLAQTGNVGQSADWSYVSAGAGAQSAGTDGATQWFSSYSLSATITSSDGMVASTQNLTLGTAMLGDVTANGSNALIISEVAPAAGTYTLNSVSITATSARQILQWYLPTGDSTFVSGNALDFTSSGSVGAIGFSAATTPEPGSIGLLFAGGIGLLARRRRHA